MGQRIKRASLAGTLVALASVATLAAEPRMRLSEYLGGEPTHINNSRGRRVQVVRAAQDMEPSADPFSDEVIETPQPVPESGDVNLQEQLQQWESGGSDCATGNCSAPCDDCSPPCGDCGCMMCCCTPPWAHRTYVFGEYLYLLPTDADMAHAFQQNGVGGPGTVPDGRVGVLQPDFESAYRVGFGVALGCYASLGASYSRFDSHTTDELAAPSGVGGNVQSLVLHPNSLNAGSTSSLVNAALDIDYQTADLEYRRLVSSNYKHGINYGVGVRYGKLQQNFLQVGDFAPPTGRVRTTTDITFEGVGLRAGLDGEHRLGCTGFAGYGKLFMNVLFGEFQSNYTQFNTTTDSLQALSNWDDRRVLPILEYEVGVSWTSRNGRWRAASGYYTAFWYNTITTGELVQAVQNADFVDVGETIAFTGFVTRIEFRR